MFSLLLMCFVGFIFILIGWRIWKKEHIELIHSYHYTKVSKEDKKKYTEKMGKACIIMGIGMIISETVNFYAKVSFGWIIFLSTFTLGMIIIIRAQIKYNKGIF